MSVHQTPGNIEQSLLMGPELETCEGEVRELLSGVKQAFGFIPNATRLLAVSPHVLASELNAIDYFQRHPDLSPALLAMIRLLVSHQADCRYCIDMNSAMLIQAGFSLEAIQSARDNPATAPLPPREKALLLFVLSAVKEPRSTTASDLQGLRDQGWSDQAIFDALYQGAHMLTIDTLFETFRVPSDMLFAS